MLVAQAPGSREDLEGRMFIGPSGTVLDALLDAAGIGRGDLYMTNLVKCHLPKNRNPRRAEIEACARHLAREIELVSPEIIVPMGYHASRHVLDACGIAGLEARSGFGGVCGKLHRCGGRKVFPLPHPSSVLYGRSKLEGMKALYGKLSVLSTECRWYALCPLKRATERGLINGRWTELYCRGDWGSCARFALEEAGESHPDSMLPDGTIDESLGARGWA